MIEAIIFDLDGTLINSIPIFLKAYEKAFNKELHIDPPDEVVLRQFGKSSTDIISGILDEMCVDSENIDIEAVLADVRDDFIEHIKNIVILPGVFELLGRLKGRYRLALATSSRHHYTGKVLEKFGMSKYFDAVVTADDVVRAKPAPDIFLAAAKKLGVKPANCLVVEDAVYGVMAADAAGMKAVAVTTGCSPREELQMMKPLAVLDSLKDFDLDILK